MEIFVKHMSLWVTFKGNVFHSVELWCDFRW